MTTGVVNGTDLRLYIDSTKIGRPTTCNVDFSVETRQTLDKDSPGNGWSEFSAGQKTGTMGTSGFLAFDTPNELVSEIFTRLKNGTVAVIRFTTDVVGDTYWEASVICTALSITGPVEADSTFDMTFQITGEPTQGTES